jgi:hypothetical protein
LKWLELLTNCAGVETFARELKMPAILLWLLGVPIPIIILLVLLWH